MAGFIIQGPKVNSLVCHNKLSLYLLIMLTQTGISRLDDHFVGLERKFHFIVF